MIPTRRFRRSTGDDRYAVVSVEPSSAQHGQWLIRVARGLAPGSLSTGTVYGPYPANVADTRADDVVKALLAEGFTPSVHEELIEALSSSDPARRARAAIVLGWRRERAVVPALLAAARGHRTMPGVATIQDMKSRSLLRADDELDELIQKSLRTIRSQRFTLSIYFGCNLAERHASLSRALFNLFPVPLMRASFARSSTTGLWRLASLAPIPVGDLPARHRAFLRNVIENHFARRGPAGPPGP